MFYTQKNAEFIQ